MHEIYSAFINAGFNQDQAMELLLNFTGRYKEAGLRLAIRRLSRKDRSMDFKSNSDTELWGFLENSSGEEGGRILIEIGFI